MRLTTSVAGLISAAPKDFPPSEPSLIGHEEEGLLFLSPVVLCTWYGWWHVENVVVFVFSFFFFYFHGGVLLVPFRGVSVVKLSDNISDHIEQ